MIHYHGTPISKRNPHLEKLMGKHFCVSYAFPHDQYWCIENAQSIMWDNGAFTTYTKGKDFNVEGYMDWLNDKLYAANWAVVPDVIGGSVEEQENLAGKWRYPDHLSCYVWHMDLPLTYLEKLLDNYPKVAFGSSGEYWNVGSDSWSRRADKAFEVVEKVGNRNWIHMMRGLRLSGKRWPFASADSTNIARNHNGSKRSPRKCTKEMADRIDSVQCPLKFSKDQLEIVL